jgi:hypothetical protein
VTQIADGRSLFALSVYPPRWSAEKEKKKRKQESKGEIRKRKGAANSVSFVERRRPFYKMKVQVRARTNKA